MPRALTLVMYNSATYAMHIPLTTTRLITVPVNRAEVPVTIVGLNPTEAAAWGKAVATPPVQTWVADGLLGIFPFTQTVEDGRREIV